MIFSVTSPTTYFIVHGWPQDVAHARKLTRHCVVVSVASRRASSVLPPASKLRYKIFAYFLLEIIGHVSYLQCGTIPTKYATVVFRYNVSRRNPSKKVVRICKHIKHSQNSAAGADSLWSWIKRYLSSSHLSNNAAKQSAGGIRPAEKPPCRGHTPLMNWQRTGR